MENERLLATASLEERCHAARDMIFFGWHRDPYLVLSLALWPEPEVLAGAGRAADAAEGRS